MALSWNEIKNRAINFSKEWESEAREHAESQSFWNEFFNIFGISRKRVASFEEPVKKLGEKIGDNGKCAFITTINPLEYAVYKKWLSVQSYREPMKRDRDLKQSYLVTQLIKDFMFTVDIDVELNNIKNMSIEAIEDYKKIILSKSSSGALMTSPN